jgi:hypothetical protein
MPAAVQPPAPLRGQVRKAAAAAAHTRSAVNIARPVMQLRCDRIPSALRQLSIALYPIGPAYFHERERVEDLSGVDPPRSRLTAS